MASDTNRIRLHPVAIDDTLGVSVQARLQDPLWLLGRQWQMDEFRHDAGSTPVEVQVQGSISPLSRLMPTRAMSTVARTINAHIEPLETLAECESVPEDWSTGLRQRVDAGLHLLRMLRSARLYGAAEAWTLRCPLLKPADLEFDAETTSWLDAMIDRVPDGVSLRATIVDRLEPGHDKPPSPAEADILRAWLKWQAERFDEPTPGESCWQTDRMQYAFKVAGQSASGEVVLEAPQYVSGTLDWYEFDQVTGAMGAFGPAKALRRYRIPAPLSFAGMPNPRFWTFEDAASRWDAIETLSNDKAPLSPAVQMVLDFALTYSDDWFLLPLHLPAWSIFETTAVMVKDVFGQTVTALPPTGRWNVFRLDAENISGALASAMLLTGPARAREGPIIEELELLRDETANIAWAVERRIPHPLRGGTPATQPIRALDSNQETGLTWSLVPQTMPTHWFPLVPVAESTKLQLGSLWSSPAAKPSGLLLGEVRAGKWAIQNEEIPSGGIRIIRRWQTTRACDGSLHVWIGRSKIAGGMETEPVIKFDEVKVR